MARPLAAAIVASLLAVSGAAGAGSETPRRGGTVVVRALIEPQCLNWLQSCGSAALVAVLEEVLAGAYDVGPRHVEPNLVSRVDFTRAPPFTLTYHIRPEARWSDGVPVSARDFVFTQAAIRKYVQADIDNTDLVYQQKKVRSVRALDAKTVRVVLTARLAGWPTLFGIVLPRHALRGVALDKVWEDRVDNPRTGEPIASGPFLVRRWERGEQLTLVRNPPLLEASPGLSRPDRCRIRFR